MRVSGNGPSCQTPNHKSACPGGTEFPGIHSNYLLLYRGFGATYYRGGGFPSGSVGKKICLQGRRHSRHRFDPWVRKIPWRKWQPTPVFFPGDSHGQRSLVCYSPWGFGAGGVHTAKASRGESSFRGKGSAPGCIPKLVLPRPD